MCDNRTAVENATASIEMEGFKVSEESKAMCEKVLDGKMSFEEYLTYSLKRAGVTA